MTWWLSRMSQRSDSKWYKSVDISGPQFSASPRPPVSDVTSTTCWWWKRRSSSCIDRWRCRMWRRLWNVSLVIQWRRLPFQDPVIAAEVTMTQLRADRRFVSWDLLRRWSEPIQPGDVRVLNWQRRRNLSRERCCRGRLISRFASTRFATTALTSGDDSIILPVGTETWWYNKITSKQSLLYASHGIFRNVGGRDLQRFICEQVRTRSAWKRTQPLIGEISNLRSPASFSQHNGLRKSLSRVKELALQGSARLLMQQPVCSVQTGVLRKSLYARKQQKSRNYCSQLGFFVRRSYNS